MIFAWCAVYDSDSISISIIAIFRHIFSPLPLPFIDIAHTLKCVSFNTLPSFHQCIDVPFKNSAYMLRCSSSAYCTLHVLLLLRLINFIWLTLTLSWHVFCFFFIFFLFLIKFDLFELFLHFILLLRYKIAKKKLLAKWIRCVVVVFLYWFDKNRFALCDVAVKTMWIKNRLKIVFSLHLTLCWPFNC